MQIHRNEPCPCGSGRKYKRCCAGKRAVATAPARRRRGPLLGLFVVLALGGLAFALLRDGSPGAAKESAPATDAAGRVWSAEHGHWHGPDGRELPASESAAPPPGGEPGQVWSEAHGHWHDAR